MARYREFVRDDKTLGEGEPIWINEMGFATIPGKSERDQANWWARAVSTFLADPHIEHIGVYEIKDLPHGKDSIGDEKNHFLGLTRADRTKKLAFHTVALLKTLLGSEKITPADDGALTVSVSKGEASELHWHLFKRSDGKQVFVYDKSGSPTVRVKFQDRGNVAVKYELDGTSASYANYDGSFLDEVSLSPGNVAIFRIDP